MNYQVFVQRQPDHKFTASVAGIPNCVVEANTKEEAVSKAKAALAEQLATGEWVTVEMNSDTLTQIEDPWLRHLGIFANDPTFDDFLAEAAAYRQAVNTQEVGA